MKQEGQCIHSFFESLTIDTDARDGHHFGEYLQQAVIRFRQSETKEQAYDVYRVFLECYGRSGSGDGMNFLSFSQTMRGYEENAAVLTKKQRDHFVHSVNVFLLGLAIYEGNRLYRQAFLDSVYGPGPYTARKSTPKEEFLFRWGLAALCHDIGYPIEIITNQVNDFINFSSRIGCDCPTIHAHVEYDRFDLVNTIPESIPKKEFIRQYYDAYDSCVYIDLLNPIDLLAHRLHVMLGLNLAKVKDRLNGYLADSGRTGRVDHGFFSAIIMLKWFGYLIQRDKGNPDEFYTPILDAATAVLLHNFYNIALVKNTSRPNAFMLEHLDVKASPLSYLLILCDELQEWNREAYGEIDKKRNGIQTAEAMISDAKMEISYILTKGTMPEEFVGSKMGLLNTLLNLDGVFPGGLHISCEGIMDLPTLPGSYALSKEHLEKLAIAIHNRYNETAMRMNPGAQPDYPTYADLPQEKKYYNFRAAMDYPVMLGAVDCEIRPLGSGSAKLLVNEFNEAEVEILAMREHDRWLQGRREQGYRYAPKSDKANKLNQYMIDYEVLPEEIKEYDRDPARDIPNLLRGLGLGVYRKFAEPGSGFTDAEIERMAEVIHHCYNEISQTLHTGAEQIPYGGLTEEIKDSNRRQARGIPNKLKYIDCVLLPSGAEGCGEPVTAFTAEDIERLAVIEHDEWMGDKIRHGWTYGPVRDKARKKNPFIVDYESLSETHKELDRNTIRRMPEVVAACGYAIYRALKNPTP